jgi:hypothetical protein
MAELTPYRFRLLRYSPNDIAGEFYNVGVLLYDESERLLDARFASEFRRMRCHPLAEMELLETLRHEFEEQRLLGEGFSEYVEALLKRLARSLQVSERRSFEGREAAAEMDRLYRVFVATPPRLRSGDEERGVRPGTRRALRRQMDRALERHGLLGARPSLEADVAMQYGGARLAFTFDYRYQPNGVSKLLHGVAQRNDVNEASKLCLAFERIRGRSERPLQLTAVVDEAVPPDTLDLLESSEIRTWRAGRLDELAMAIRGELGL